MLLRSLYKRNIILIIVIVFLILITISTNYFGSVDIGDYADTAKFFAGKYDAKIRSSHSYLYGAMYSPLISITNSFIMFKIGSLIFLLLTVFSIYLINGKNKKSLWLMLLSPVVWYMAPWISPIQLSALLLLWAYYFMVRYDKTDKTRYLSYSGILMGVGWAFWDTILFFIIFLALSFMYDKKLNHFFYLVVFVFVGLFPRLIFDYTMFNFAFFSILKSLGGQASFILWGSIYEASYFGNVVKVFNIIMLLLAIPLYYWLVYSPIFFRENKKSVIFISLCLLLILLNPQIRVIMAIAPIMILLIGRKITYIQFKRQIVFSIFVITLFIFPYIIQINYSIGDDNFYGAESSYLIKNIFDIELNKEFPEDVIVDDLKKILEEFPDETFLVGTTADSYQVLAHFYWEDKIKEFVSIQDYELYLKNESEIFSRRFMPVLNINDRRQIWIAGGINKNEKDDTDYNSINYMINFGNESVIDGFEKIREYEKLTLWIKIK